MDKKGEEEARMAGKGLLSALEVGLRWVGGLGLLSALAGERGGGGGGGGGGFGHDVHISCHPAGDSWGAGLITHCESAH